MIAPRRDALCKRQSGSDRPNFGCRHYAPFQVLLIALSAINAVAENPEMAMDKMTDEELRTFRDQKIIELRAHRQQFHPEQTADGITYPRIFFCTIYYTPKESGFTTERGFDATPITAAGLHGHKYPRDFLLAVKRGLRPD